MCEVKFEDGDETIEFFGGYAHCTCFDKQMKKNEEKKKDLLKNKNFIVIPLEKWDMPILTNKDPVPKKDDIPEFTELNHIRDDKEENNGSE